MTESTHSQPPVNANSGPRAASPERITIFIAEDDALLRDCLMEMLSLQDDLAVVGSSTNGADVVEAVCRLRPRVLLLDLRMPGLAGEKVLERLGLLSDPPLVLVLTGDETEETQLLVARCGAHGFLPKSQALTVLPDAIRTVARGELWFTRQTSTRILREYHTLVRRTREQDRPTHKLSENERKVLICLARGLTNNQIARELYMSVHSVKVYAHNIYRKLNLPNRTEAAVYAVREGLLDQEEAALATA